ncbi:MAG: MBL fold metallo-hydrolase [Candidatus Thermoplasmatota archaeon]|nr:MBL fold metallo-hydrolase [Candidatus Thermoplasmatota archaeon]
MWMWYRMEIEQVWVESFIVGPLSMRCSIITDIYTGDTIIIDGGAEAQRLISWIDDFSGRGPDWSSGPKTKQESLLREIPKRKVIALVNTHAHFDHSGEIPILLDRYKVSWYLHKDDFYLQSLVQTSARRWGIELPNPAVADEVLTDGMELRLGSLQFNVFHTPGHTLGGCCLLLKVDDGPDQLFAGDTLFAGSVGRTDLPNSGGDFDLLSNSIITKLWPLESDTVVYPGHGPVTTIGVERATNPFVGSNSPAFGKYH